MADQFLAVDLGAESGRVIAGNLERFEVVHRFANAPVLVGESLHWDLLQLYAQIKSGLRLAGDRGARSVGIDTWGVDYGLLDRSGAMLGAPYHYRDARTDGVPAAFDAIIPRSELYEETGLQTMPFNTLYQLYAQQRRQPDLMAIADRFLTLPDLLNYWLTGSAVNEFTIASTTQLRNPRSNSWSARVLAALGVPSGWFSEPVMPGTEIGALQATVAGELGMAGLRVVAPACHDTASAVVAVPTEDPTASVYISSGTWSLLGVEAADPVITDKSFAHNFTNEGAADGGTRLLRNIMGLWIVQECRRQWATEGREYGYEELSRMAEEAGPVSSSIDPNDERFLKPGLTDDGMVDRIQAWCRETDQPVPEEPAVVVRTVHQSLAAAYAEAVTQLEDIIGVRYRRVHVIGGGSQNRVLCQLTADACGRQVLAGPAEATALGNLLLQSLAAGVISSIEEGRAAIRASAEIAVYNPR